MGRGVCVWVYLWIRAFVLLRKDGLWWNGGEAGMVCFVKKLSIEKKVGFCS